MVANLAQRSSTTPVHTFTLAFEEEQFNEGHHARQIAAAIGTSHCEVMLTEGDFVGGLETALESLDQPTFDGLNSYYMSRAIRQAGFTVALVGSGGDELFGGYTSFRDLPVLRRWVDRLRLVPRAALAAAAGLAVGAARRGRGPIPPQTRWAKLPDMVRRGDDLLALYQLAYALFLPGFQERLLADGPLPDGLPAPMRSRIAEESQGRTPLAAIGVMEQRLFLGERLLRDNDAASMAASIEQRLPLVDQAVLEYVGGLPDDLRFQPVRRKELLRRVGLRGLSPALFDRPKSGFVLPFDRWLRASLGRRLDDTMRDPAAARAVGLEPQTVAALWKAFQESAPGVHWSRLWAIYILMRWCQRHGVVR